MAHHISPSRLCLPSLSPSHLCLHSLSPSNSCLPFISLSCPPALAFLSFLPFLPSLPPSISSLLLSLPLPSFLFYISLSLPLSLPTNWCHRCWNNPPGSSDSKNSAILGVVFLILCILIVEVSDPSQEQRMEVVSHPLTSPTEPTITSYTLKLSVTEVPGCVCLPASTLAPSGMPQVRWMPVYYREKFLTLLRCAVPNSRASYQFLYQNTELIIELVYVARKCVTNRNIALLIISLRPGSGSVWTCLHESCNNESLLRVSLLVRELIITWSKNGGWKSQTVSFWKQVKNEFMVTVCLWGVWRNG